MKTTLNDLVQRNATSTTFLWTIPKRTLRRRIRVAFYVYVTGPIRTVRVAAAHVFQNLWLLKHVWRFRPWDAAYKYALLYDIYDKMVIDFERGNDMVDSSKSIKSLKICREACKRLRDPVDTYVDVTEKAKLFSDRYVICSADDTKGPRETLANEIKRNGNWWW